MPLEGRSVELDIPIILGFGEMSSNRGSLGSCRTTQSSPLAHTPSWKKKFHILLMWLTCPWGLGDGLVGSCDESWGLGDGLGGLGVGECDYTRYSPDPVEGSFVSIDWMSTIL